MGRFHTSRKPDIVGTERRKASPVRLDRRVLTTVTGASRLPVPDADADYFLRIRKRLRYGYAGDWSPVYPVKKMLP